MTDEELLKEMEKRAEAYHDKIKRDFAIEELTKLWSQIYDIEEPDNDFEGFYHCQNEALELINKRISELKGDSNAKNKTD